jgi:serine/threonine-protein kinase/endoribonuclease IRE1
MAFLYRSVLILTLVLVATCVAEIVTLKAFQQDRAPGLAKRSKPYRFLPLPIAANAGADNEDELELLDIVLLASVDGKFHALNRKSGQMLWSMSSAGPGRTPSTLAPLVRTNHVESDPEITDDDSPNEELYIVEPQSGDIYVLSSPQSPLQRLSLSMSQLVDLSPFSFTGEENRRIFLGKKETSLMLLELETGKVKESLNSECPWTPFEDLHESARDIDLDDLEGTTLSKPTEIFIGRTGKQYSLPFPFVLY